MFKPTHIVFAPSTRCNLACSHCRVTRSGSELSIDDAVAFLDDCAGHGIDRLGFSGGEPFLSPDFLVALCAAAVEQGMLFDRLMTNACWFESDEVLRETLSRVYEAGFDGTIGVSADVYHGQDAATLYSFFDAVNEIWGRKDGIELVSVRSHDDSAFVATLRALASRLGGRLVLEDGEPVRIVDDRFEANRERGLDDGSGLRCEITRIPYSAAGDPDPAAGWNAERWFEDDFCEGPGNVFYVHPDGRVAACCGFANENPQLVIGSVVDGYERLMANAEANAHVRNCYETGLAAMRGDMARRGSVFPGKTDDPCFFCDWLCRSGRV